LIHALPDTEPGGKVIDSGHVPEGRFHRGRIAHVASTELDLRREITWPVVPGAVHLRAQIVESAYPVAVPEQLVGEVGANEPGSPRDEDMVSHRRSRMCPRRSGAPGRQSALVDLGVVERTLALPPCKREASVFLKGWFRRSPRPTGDEEIS
jgi:hypothetical protein